MWGRGCADNWEIRAIRNKLFIEARTQKETVICNEHNAYIDYGLLFTWRVCEFFVSIENFVPALGPKSRYFPPSSLVISDVRSGTDDFLLITNLTHFLISLFIAPLSVFRASQCSSSGDRIVLIHHLVWVVWVNAWYAGQEGTHFPPDRHTKQSLTQTNHTRWCINTIRSPDDEHCDARNT